MKVLIIGDIIGKAGRRILEETLQRTVDRMNIDFTIANCENSAGGFGVTREIAGKLFAAGIDVMTSGNHIWDKKEAVTYIAEEERILRPANYPICAPGRGGWVFKTKNGVNIGVINLSGRIFMDPLDCPFQAADREIAKIKTKSSIIIVDIHAEATSEKMAMGWHLDGRVSAVVGTHTHVQTSDERILPCGTAYITDIGMTGPKDSVIGIKKEIALHKFITRMPKKFEIAAGDVQLDGVVVDINDSSGKAKGITRVKVAK